MCNTGELWNSIVLTVIGVYIPFFNGSKDQIQLYVETLEQLQDIIESFSNSTPCIIMGDVNASLPQKKFSPLTGINEDPIIKIACYFLISIS